MTASLLSRHALSLLFDNDMMVLFNKVKQLSVCLADCPLSCSRIYFVYYAPSYPREFKPCQAHTYYTQF